MYDINDEIPNIGKNIEIAAENDVIMIVTPFAATRRQKLKKKIGICGMKELLNEVQPKLQQCCTHF